MIDKPYPDKENINQCTHKLVLSKEKSIYFNTCNEVSSDKGLGEFVELNKHLDSNEIFEVIKCTFMYDSLKFPLLKKRIRKLVLDRIINNL
jgi:hypothetical protein